MANTNENRFAFFRKAPDIAELKSGNMIQSFAGDEVTPELAHKIAG